MKIKLTALLLTITLVGAWIVFDQQNQSDVQQETRVKAKYGYQPLSTAEMLEQAKVRNIHHQPNTHIQPVSSQSLQGSMPDGAVNFDDYGDVVADEDLNRLFDYYLSMTGELTVQEIRSSLLMTASDFLSLNQLEQLRDYFDQYVEYLAAAEGFALSALSSGDDLYKIDTISQIRRAYLGDAMAEAFFAEEEAYARHVIQMQQTGSSDAPTDQQLKWLTVENQATAFHDVLIENQLFDELAVSSEDRMLIRTDAYGNTVAQQLADLDLRRDQWNSRVQNYIEERNLLADNQAALQQFELSFDPIELKRLQAYYRAQQQSGP